MKGRSSLSWLRDLYIADGKNGQETKTLFDVIDLHSYCKIMDGDLPWSEGEKAYPEVQESKIQNVRNVMAEFGDQDKPMIFTEMGWCTDPDADNYNRVIDETEQRDYIVRQYLLAISLGIREGYLYAFQNAGINPSETEDVYGIVDWYGIPRPAYYGYYMASSVMQGAMYLGKTANVNAPYFGLDFLNETKNGRFSALWAAKDEPHTMIVEPADSLENGLTVVYADGSLKYIPVILGQASVPVSGTPAFVFSRCGIRVIAIT